MFSGLRSVSFVDVLGVPFALSLSLYFLIAAFSFSTHARSIMIGGMADVGVRVWDTGVTLLWRLIAADKLLVVPGDWCCFLLMDVVMVLLVSLMSVLF